MNAVFGFMAKRGSPSASGHTCSECAVKAGNLLAGHVLRVKKRTATTTSTVTPHETRLNELEAAIGFPEVRAMPCKQPAHLLTPHPCASVMRCIETPLLLPWWATGSLAP